MGLLIFFLSIDNAAVHYSQMVVYTLITEVDLGYEIKLFHLYILVFTYWFWELNIKDQVREE